MISRYTREKMGQLWSQESRFQCMMEVEVAVAQVQADKGLIPADAAKAIASKAKFSIPRILEIEKETKHDVIAFVSNMAENVGEEGRYIHYGLTSSDVLDTALSVQTKKAGLELLNSMDALLNSLAGKMQDTSDIICSGRTHGMHAEPTTFGYKLSGFYAEFKRHRVRLQKALAQMAICKLSGAVGTYSFLSPEIESGVANKLGLTQETLATQVIPRDRHAELMSTFAMIGGGLERLSVELRHLQRNEVGEAYEGFTKGQKGSSAMPHKKNPISSENLTGCARLLRANALAAFENMALWHERDISHSSVERVIFPDSFILCDYALDRMTTVIANLQVDEDRMKANMDLSQGQLFSSHLLLHLVDKGLSREDAYKKIQSVSHGLKQGEHLRDQLMAHAETKKYFDKATIDEIFSGKRHLKQVKTQISKVMVYDGHV